MKLVVTRSYPAIVIVLAITFGGYAVYWNPSIPSSHQSFETMSRDMSQILAIGGTVAYTYKSDKYGGASLLHGVIAGSLPPLVRDHQGEVLRQLGWTKVADQRYCKDGILYYSKLANDRYEYKPVVIIAMNYDPETIDECNATRMDKSSGRDR